MWRTSSEEAAQSWRVGMPLVCANLILFMNVLNSWHANEPLSPLTDATFLTSDATGSARSAARTALRMIPRITSCHWGTREVVARVEVLTLLIRTLTMMVMPHPTKGSASMWQAWGGNQTGEPLPRGEALLIWMMVSSLPSLEAYNLRKTRTKTSLHTKHQHVWAEGQRWVRRSSQLPETSENTRQLGALVSPLPLYNISRDPCYLVEDSWNNRVPGIYKQFWQRRSLCLCADEGQKHVLICTVII